MAYEVPTVKIADPNKPGDFIVMAEFNFDAAKGHRLFQSSEPDRPAVPAKEPSSSGPDAAQQASIATALDVPVSRLGAWLAEQDSVELLVVLLDREPRPSAKTLITSRIKAVRKAQEAE